MTKIKYKSGYKYQLAEQYEIEINIFPDEDVISYYIQLSKSGKLRITRGYSWDGPSGPTFDTKNFMRGSLVHDALYQLLRNGLLEQEVREQVDIELVRICREDGMSRLRAWVVLKGVKHFAAWAADPKNKKKIHTAP